MDVVWFCIQTYFIPHLLCVKSMRNNCFDSVFIVFCFVREHFIQIRTSLLRWRDAKVRTIFSWLTSFERLTYATSVLRYHPRNLTVVKYIYKEIKKTLLPIRYSESDSCIFEKLKRNRIFKQFKSIWKRKFPNDIDKQDCLSKHRIQLFKTYMLREGTALHLQSLNPKWNEL